MRHHRRKFRQSQGQRGVIVSKVLVLLGASDSEAIERGKVVEALGERVAGPAFLLQVIGVCYKRGHYFSKCIRLPLMNL